MASCGPGQVLRYIEHPAQQIVCASLDPNFPWDARTHEQQRTSNCAWLQRDRAHMSAADFNNYARQLGCIEFSAGDEPYAIPMGPSQSGPVTPNPTREAKDVTLIAPRPNGGGNGFSPTGFTPGTGIPAPTGGTDPLSIPDIIRTGASTLCRFFPHLCGQESGGGTTGTPTIPGGGFPSIPGGSGGNPLTGNCPDGFVFRNGQCERTGIRGTAERFFPGGSPGTVPSGEATVGAMGIPAVFPRVVGQRESRGGTVPLLECPTGMVLGKDNLCYVKGSIGRKWRKWPPAARPPITAGDAKAIRRADAAKKRVKKLATKTGFTCKRR